MAAKTPFTVPLTGGLEGNTEQQLKTSLETAENYVYAKKGGLRKRFGTKRRLLPTTAMFSPMGVGRVPPPIPVSIAPYGKSTLAFGNGMLSALASLDSTGVGDPEQKQRVYEDQYSDVLARTETIVGGGLSCYSPDLAVWTSPDGSRKLACFVYLRDGDVMSTIIDLVSGAVVMENVEVDPGTVSSHPRIILIPQIDTFVLTRRDTVDQQIYAYLLFPASLGNGQWTTGTPISVGGILSPYDICTDGLGNLILLQLDGSGNLNLSRHDPANLGVPSITVVDTGLPGDPIHSAALLFDGTYIWAGYSFYDTVAFTSETSVAVYTAATFVRAHTPIFLHDLDIRDMGLCSISAVYGGYPTIVVVQQGYGNIYINVVFIDGTVLYGDDHATYFTEDHTRARLLSRPWNYNNRVYFVVRVGGGVHHTQAGTIHIFDSEFKRDEWDVYPCRTVATVAPIQAVNVPLDEHDTPTPGLFGSLPCSAIQIADAKWLTAHARPVTNLSSYVGSIVQMTASFGEPIQTAESSLKVLFAGGTPHSFDGLHAVECGFFEKPSIRLLSTVGSLAPGTYSYIVVFEWIDSNGNIFRSAPSASETITLASPGGVTVSWQVLDNTQKQEFEQGTQVVAVIYRTSLTDASTYRRVAQVRNPYGETPFSPSYTDTASDDSIAHNEQVYSTGLPGSYLPTTSPPSAGLVVAHKNRFWLGDTDSGAIWYSKKFVTNVGPEFHVTLTIDWFKAGEVTAMAGVDDYIFFFTKDEIWYVLGDGLDATGTTGTLTEPRMLHSDVGCIAWRSVVTNTFGTFFLSSRGIYLLSRGSNNIIFVGEDVQHLTQREGFEVTSAVLVPSQNQVRFTLLSEAAPTEGVTLIFDTVSKKWTTAKYYDAYLGAFRGAQSAALVADQYVWVTPEGQEYEEDQTSHFDAESTYVDATVETGWIHLGAIEGFQRVSRAKLLGEKLSDSKMIMTVFQDYDNTATQTSTRLTEDFDVAQFEYDFVRQRCEAIKIRLQDTRDPDVIDLGTGQGMSLNALSLLATVGRGHRFLARTRR